VTSSICLIHRPDVRLVQQVAGVAITRMSKPASSELQPGHSGWWGNRSVTWPRPKSLTFVANVSVVHQSLRHGRQLQSYEHGRSDEAMAARPRRHYGGLTPHPALSSSATREIRTKPMRKYWVPRTSPSEYTQLSASILYIMPRNLHCNVGLRFVIPSIYGYKRIRNQFRWNTDNSPQNIPYKSTL